MHVESQDAKIHTVCNVTHTPRKAMDIQVHDAPAHEYNNFQSLWGSGAK